MTDSEEQKRAELAPDDPIEVFELDNPGWGSKMILKTLDEVLEAIRADLEDWEDGVGYDEPTSFTVNHTLMQQGEFDALEEWCG